MRRVFAGADGVQHLLQPVQRLLGGIEMLRFQRRLAGAHQAQGLFGGMAQVDHGLDAQEAGAAFQRVEATEYRVELLAVGRVLFQRDQLFAQPVEDFLRFDQEVGGDFRGDGGHGRGGYRNGRSTGGVEQAHRVRVTAAQDAAGDDIADQQHAHEQQDDGMAGAAVGGIGHGGSPVPRRASAGLQAQAGQQVVGVVLREGIAVKTSNGRAGEF